MRCDRCGATAPVLKTVRWRDHNGGPFILCDSCWLPISAAVWIVPGQVAAFGRCRHCSGWFGVRELTGLKPGGRRDAWIGTCRRCAV